MSEASPQPQVLWCTSCGHQHFHGPSCPVLGSSSAVGQPGGHPKTNWVSPQRVPCPLGPSRKPSFLGGSHNCAQWMPLPRADSLDPNHIFWSTDTHRQPQSEDIQPAGVMEGQENGLLVHTRSTGRSRCNHRGANTCSPPTRV